MKFWCALAQEFQEAGWDEWPGQVPGEPGTVEHYHRWASELVFDDGQRHPPEEWFLDFVRDLFHGYKELWLIVPEGNSKSTGIASLALYHLETVIRPWVPLGAASRDQAEILFGQAVGFIESTPGLKYDKETNPTGPFEIKGTRQILHRFNGGRGLRVYAADKETADGVIPTLPITDEGHRQRDLGLYRLWKGKCEKRGGRSVMISTRGEPGTDFEKALSSLRRASTERQRRGRCFTRYESEEAVLHEYSVPRELVEDMEAVKEANPLSTITVETLRRKRLSPTLDFGQSWLRLTCNVPARSSRIAISELDYDRAGKVYDSDPLEAVSDEHLHIPEGVPVLVGADFAWLLDTTALVPMWVCSPTLRLMGECRILVPPRDGSMLDVLAVKSAFEQINERNPIAAVIGDSTKAQDVMQWCANELGARVIDRSQANSQAVEDYDAFMEALRGGVTADHHGPKPPPWIRHDNDVTTQVYVDGQWWTGAQAGGNTLRDHVMNAIARKLSGDQYRFDRQTPSRAAAEQDNRVIDGLQAASMVNRAAAVWEDEGDMPMVAVVAR